MVFGSLTAMRGVAALLVAFFHLRYGVIGVPLFDLHIFQFRFGNRGYLWVDFFAPHLDFPSWSLSCEWGAYLVLPLYLWAVWPVKRGTAHLLFIAGYLGLLLWYSAHFGNGTLDRLREKWRLGRCLIEVAIGASLFPLHAVYRSRKMEPIYDAAAALIFCAILVVFTFSTYDFYFVSLAVG